MKISFERKVNSTTWVCGRCGVTLEGGCTRPSGWQRIRQADNECTFWPPVYLRDSDIEEERCDNCSADPRNLEEIARLWDALHQESEAISKAIEELQDILYNAPLVYGNEEYIALTTTITDLTIILRSVHFPDIWPSTITLPFIRAKFNEEELLAIEEILTTISELKQKVDYLVFEDREEESKIRNAIAELYLEKDQYQEDLYELEREEAEYKRRYQRSNRLFSRMVND